MIEFDQVSVTYHGATRATLTGVDLLVPEGELCLVTGRTGSGKSTLLRSVSGLVPHFTGGTLQGRVRVGGRDTADHPPRELADVVGSVLQDPADGFVTDVVEDELAYTMESLGLATDVMRRRVEETLDLLGLVDLRYRALTTLSGGERQRVALAAVLTAHPSVLVLDEPTSALDPGAAEEVLAALHRLVHDLGLTVLLAEHRLERVVQHADRIVHVPGGGAAVRHGDPAAVLATSGVVPPIVELGRLAGWDPLPLSIRDARRRSAALRDQLRDRAPVRPAVTPGHQVAVTCDLSVRYGPRVALRAVDVSLHAGEVTAIMGRNGAGKSTLLRALTGLTRPDVGAVRVSGQDPAVLRPRELLTRVGLVPQEHADLLYADTVAAECRAADRDAGVAPGTCRARLDRLVPDVDDSIHPRDLSEGQRLGLVLAIVLTGDPQLLLLDEPTRGLDYPAKSSLARELRTLAANGHAVALATHDVEFAATVADRTLVLADGEVVVDGPTADVVVGSPAYAPQVTRILAPTPFLTVAEVAAALGEAS